MATSLMLPDHHLSFTSDGIINQICAPLFKYLKVKLFSYARYYLNGESLILSNCKNWLTNHFINGYLSPAPIPENLIEKEESFHLASLDYPYYQCTYDLINKFNSSPGIRLIYNKKHYIEVFCFTYASSEFGAINNFINNLDAYKRFALYFRDKAATLIKNAEQNKIMLPKQMRGLDFSNVHPDNVIVINSDEFEQDIKINKYYIEGNYGYVGLSQQESRCTYFLINGNSIKETAKLMALSPRTIEGYLNSVKLKLGCKSKNEVIRLLKNERYL